MAQPLKSPTDRIVVAVCDCCGAHAVEYPGEVFSVCAVGGRGTYQGEVVTLAVRIRSLPKERGRSHVA